MQSSSIRIPALMHDDVVIWDTIAIAEYLNEMFPERGHVAGRTRRPRPLPLDLAAKCTPASRSCARRCR